MMTHMFIARYNKITPVEVRIIGKQYEYYVLLTRDDRMFYAVKSELIELEVYNSKLWQVLG